MNKELAISKLQEQITEIRSVIATARFSPTFHKWHRDTRIVLKNVFVNHPEYIKEFAGIRYNLRVCSSNTPASAHQEAYIRGIERAEAFIESCIQEINTFWEEGSLASAKPHQDPYIDESRLNELAVIKSPAFDLTKLLSLCRELNAAHANKAYYSIIMLIRSIIDHVPPIFGCKTFAQVASETKGKSLKALLTRLDNTLREIANIHLHDHIQKKEPILTATQVNFRNELDALLSEIERKFPVEAE